MPDTVVKMPQLGESVAEGTIGRWLKQPGEHVERDEPLVEIQTDKVNAEVPSPVAGVLREILLPEGTTAAVKTDMAIIGDEADASNPQPSAEAPPSEMAPDEAQPTAQGPEGTTAERTPAASSAAQPAPLTFTYDTSPGGGVVGHREPESTVPNGAKRFYTPVVLRMAEEHGIDLSTIEGTGAQGRVTRKDVERAIASGSAESRVSEPPRAAPPAPAPVQPTPAPSTPAAAQATPAPAPSTPAATQPASAPAPSAPGGEHRPLTPMRRAIAEHMTRARTEIPDAWSLVEVDVTALARLRDRYQAEWQAREGYELTYLPFFVKAVVAGLRAVPELNASWQGDHVRIHRRYDLGIAVSVEGGLVVPVLRDADSLSVAGIARALRELIQKARGGRLQAADLQGATFTVNNPGSLGSIMSQPIVPVGQAGIVTMEAIVRRPVVLADDAIGIRGMMNTCLSFDHRVLDGAGALRFLREIKHQLESVEYPLY